MMKKEHLEKKITVLTKHQQTKIYGGEALPDNTQQNIVEKDKDGIKPPVH